MDDINYEIGQLQSEVTQLKLDTSEIKMDVKEIKSVVDNWKSTAVGALTVLSAIGAIILYFSDTFIQYVKVKLGF